MKIANDTITSIQGIFVGHVTDSTHQTGCTAVLCPTGFTPGIFISGFAPSTRETELMQANNIASTVHGIMLCGGSAFGLSAADGAMQFLSEQGYGFNSDNHCIPLVPAAVIYDLDINTSKGQLPNANMGFEAARTASNKPVKQGSIGAGVSAYCGRMHLGQKTSHLYMQKAGIGSACIKYKKTRVAAIVVTNALGNVIDPSQDPTASSRIKPVNPFSSNKNLYTQLNNLNMPKCNTVLAVIATNIPLSKVECSRLAQMASAGIPRVIFPANMPYDGNIVFSLASQEPFKEENDVWTESMLGAMAADAISQACLNSIEGID